MQLEPAKRPLTWLMPFGTSRCKSLARLCSACRLTSATGWACTLHHCRMMICLHPPVGRPFSTLDHGRSREMKNISCSNLMVSSKASSSFARPDHSASKDQLLIIQMALSLPVRKYHHAHWLRLSNAGVLVSDFHVTDTELVHCQIYASAHLRPSEIHHVVMEPTRWACSGACNPVMQDNGCLARSMHMPGAVSH